MQQREGTVYPAIIFSSIAHQIVVCIVVALVFKDPIRVFVQRDDGQSNMSRLDALSGWFGRLRERIQHQIRTRLSSKVTPEDEEEGRAYELQIFEENTSRDEWALKTASALEETSTHIVSGS